MVEQLEPCPGCRRHVRIGERDCPFCGGALNFEGLAPPLLPTERLSRGQFAAFRSLIKAGLVGGSALGLTNGCVSDQAIYGAPCNPPECGVPTTGGASGSGQSAGTGASGGTSGEGGEGPGGEGGAGGEGGR